MQRNQDNNGLGYLNIEKVERFTISRKIFQIDNNYLHITKNCSTIKYFGVKLENEIFLDYVKIMHLTRSFISVSNRTIK